MKCLVKKVMIVCTVLMLILCCSTTPQAKTKKLKVNTVYTTEKKIRGTTKLQRAKVVVRIGKKTYKTISNKKGEFTLKIKKQKKSTRIKVTVYKKKRAYKTKIVKVKEKPWYLKKPFKGHNAAICGKSGVSNKKVFNEYDNSFLVYCKKGYYMRFKISGEEFVIRTAKAAGHTMEKGKTIVNTIVYSKKAVGKNRVKIKIYKNKNNKLVDSYSIVPRQVKLPKKTAEIDYNQFLKDYNQVLENGKEINKSIGNYAYKISKYNFGNWGIDYAIGYPSEYFDSTANGSHVKVTAKNGATLYCTVGTKASFNFPEPSQTDYDAIIKSGKTKKWEGTDFKEDELIGNHLCLKIYAYKNNKLVGMRTMDYYLIQGYADWMFE